MDKTFGLVEDLLRFLHEGNHECTIELRHAVLTQTLMPEVSKFRELSEVIEIYPFGVARIMN